MSAPIKQVSFAGGEITPAMYGRTDHGKYDTGLRTLRNMLAMRHGGVTGRPGTMFVGASLNSGNPVRLMPFIFNETGLGQSYILEFGNLYIAFYQNGGVVVSGGVPYKVVSPYLQADLATLDFAQCGDIVTIVHPNYPIRELARHSPINWTLTQQTLQKSGVSVPNAVASLGGTGIWTYAYYVSAVDSSGNETVLSSIFPAIAANINQPSPSNLVNITWDAVANISTYNIYRSTSGSGTIGYIGTTANNIFTDSGITPDYSHGPPILNTTIGIGAGNYPSCVGFVQQRRAFGAPANNPLGFYLSRPGSFDNFNINLLASDDNPIFSSIAGEEVNQIQHILELKFMLMLTAGAELFIQGNGSGVITPSAINASTQSQYGASPLRPLKVGDVLLFVQALGSFIRDFSFDFSIDGYHGNDITVFASHLFEGHQIVAWAFQKVPDSIVWAVREDGVLLGLTYVREQQILAWHRHDFVNGFVEDVCAIPENGAYAVYLSMRRVINGATVRYIERMSSRVWSDPIDASYLDCFLKYDGRNTSPTKIFISAGSGFVNGPTAYQQSFPLNTLTAFNAWVPYFTQNMVGDQIFLEDDLWLSSKGKKGNQIRFTIQAVIQATGGAPVGQMAAIVTPNREVPQEFRGGLLYPNWEHAIKNVGGLTHLVGQQVSVWADRFVVGSPLNTAVQTVYTVPSSGILTLDKPYSVIYIGLPMKQDFETLDRDTSFGESTLSKRKRQNCLGAYFYKTRTCFVGSENPDTNTSNVDDDPLFQLSEEKLGGARATFDASPEMITEQDYVLEVTRWNKNGRIFIRNVDPVPLTILAVSPGGDSPAPNPGYEKV